MTPPDLILVVLRSADVDGSRSLYETFGLAFVDEQHGSGPPHCSATLASGLVIEIYPSAESAGSDKTRLGFVVDDLAATLVAAVAAGAEKVSENLPQSAVIEDLDGRRVELHQASS